PALSEASDHVLHGYAHVVEEDLVEAGVLGHLEKRTDRNAGRFHIDQEIGDPRMLGRRFVRADQTEHPIRDLRVAGPDLLAVHNEVILLAQGARLERGEVTARARFGVSLTPE